MTHSYLPACAENTEVEMDPLIDVIISCRTPTYVFKQQTRNHGKVDKNQHTHTDTHGLTFVDVLTYRSKSSSTLSSSSSISTWYLLMSELYLSFLSQGHIEIHRVLGKAFATEEFHPPDGPFF